MKSFKVTKSITDRKDASLSIYFKDIYRLPLLTQEEEINLAKKIQKGDLQAENELVKGNLRFVVSVAKSYQGKGLDLVDLIQEGNCGLIESARKYDPSKNIKFITYAVWWIRQSIMKALSDQCRTVRVPINQIANMSKINKISEKYEQENGYIPSTEEIEAQTNLSKRKIDLSLASVNRTVSLESPFNSEDVNCLLDVLPNENSEEADNILISEDLSNELNRIISSLTNRESDSIRLFFGIGAKQMTYEEIANRFGVGSERIRQIVHTAIKKLRDNYGDELKTLL